MSASIDIARLSETVKTAGQRGLPPVQMWNPPFCGAIDMRIAADGTWFYLGTPIGRPALVKLFSSILRRDPERFVLVTPVEMVEIRVDDAPFIAIDMDAIEGPDGPLLVFRSNVEDEAIAGPLNPLRFTREATGGYRPYITMRAGLEARLTRRVYQDLVALGEERLVDGRLMFGVASGGTFFPIAPADEAADA
jgi:uncharacterized protein